MPAALMAAVCLLSSGLAAADETPSSGFDCQQLAQRETPETAIGWLERSLWASHCYLFQARAVRISGEGVRTLALSHEIRDGVEREAASYLDGPAVVYERHGRIARDSLPALAVRGASPQASLPTIEDHYRVSLGGESRIAGRHSVRLDIEPLDSLRYGHRLWLDRSTGLPLKQVLIDVGGQIIETFQMTELGQPTLYTGKVEFDVLPEAPPQPWQLGWLPPGYHSLALPQASSIDSLPLGHRLYSDGLASFSVFVEPLTTPERALYPGLHRLGVSHAAVRHLRVAERIYQVVVMGEVPPEMLRRVAVQIDYRPIAASQARSATP
ncbi:MucB/RseB C-terminal domain-containing protein [Halomonas sp. HP20-15]|uniref:MucB/RseB C-terminal domain-containing protein n=1 Tax=Halomonas sp. HP20-15 TaxID=3085901 RepID=UPI002981B094|nr:MucB/RseB C-terminal domain-containing protein [Halomonas sp. HP20-15]MDW5375743.1 MucB/RseB C-terminal domain-containing protein [Halomonas sp. HP20-15]